MARVFIVEDHDNLRAMIRELIDRTEGFEVCGESDNGEEALESIGETQTELALIDVSLPGINGLELVRRLQRSDPQVRCVMLSGHRSNRYVEEARAAGAKAYIAKGTVRELADILRHVLKGGPFSSS